MKFFRLFWLALFFLSNSQGRSLPPPAPGPELTLGSLQAQVGISPLTGAPSGWYTSDVTLPILAPAEVLVNGQPLRSGRLTITEEGRHALELQPGPDGAANQVTQLINLDKTPPQVTWLTEPNPAVSGLATLRAEITDATSGVCSLESSLDDGRSWDRQLIPLAAFAEGTSGVAETTWSLSEDFTTFPKGAQVILLRATDCAGNVSPGQILILRVE